MAELTAAIGSDIFSLLTADVHFGTPNVSEAQLYDALDQYLIPRLTDELDILFVAGDFFDRLLDLNNPKGLFAGMMVETIKRKAIEHDFLIRVVRGTNLHDRSQVNIFKYPDNNCRSKVFDSISVEFIESLGVTVLYLPDSLPSYDDIMGVIAEVMRDSQVTTVDYICGHGYLRHEIPPGIPDPSNIIYEYDKLAAICTGPIQFGHYHTFGTRGRFARPGSFDRTKHGEEEDKGFCGITYNPKSHKMTCEFICNEMASTFKTIDLCSYSGEEDDFLDHFMTWLRGTLASSKSINTPHIRALVSNGIIGASLKAFLKDSDVTGFIFKVEVVSDVPTEDEELEMEWSAVDLPVLTEQNLIDQLHHHIDSHERNPISRQRTEEIAGPN